MHRRRPLHQSLLHSAGRHEGPRAWRACSCPLAQHLLHCGALWARACSAWLLLARQHSSCELLQLLGLLLHRPLLLGLLLRQGLPLAGCTRAASGRLPVRKALLRLLLVLRLLLLLMRAYKLLPMLLLLSEPTRRLWLLLPCCMSVFLSLLLLLLPPVEQACGLLRPRRRCSSYYRLLLLLPILTQGWCSRHCFPQLLQLLRHERAGGLGNEPLEFLKQRWVGPQQRQRCSQQGG